MELSTFIKDFAELFEETDPGFFKSGTKFRDIKEWSSLQALSVIAMVDAKYKVKLTGDDIRESVIIEDIFNKVKTKKQ